MKFGVSYYPELVPQDEWARDLDLMREAGMDVIRMLDFAWTALEPREGRYEFAWADRFLDMAGRAGIGVVLCTPTAAPPQWLMQQYPGIMVETRSGERFTYGERRGACVNSTVYRHYSEGIARELGRRWGHHPAVIGWQIDNELIGPEFERFECHCPDCTWRFRDWLKRRYASVDEINRAWGLQFWSMAFGDWGEVPTPRCRRAAAGHVLDFYRFYNDSQVDYLELQYAALRKEIEPRQFVSHNSTGVFDRGINHRDFARALDVTGWDAYRGAAAAGHAYPEAYTALSHDMFRSALARPFWIFETNTDATIRPAYLAEMRAHGADAIVFWHWRRHRANLEQYCSALCDFAGRPHRDRIEILRRTKERLGATGDLPREIPPRRAAIVFSADCVRSEHRSLKRPIRHLDALSRMYEPLWRSGVGVDVVNPGDDLSAYALVAMPAVMLMGREQADAVRRFVERGGVLVATARTAHQDLHGVFYADPCGPLRDVFGIEVGEDVHSNEAPKIAMDGAVHACEPGFESVTPAGARTLGAFAGGPVDGRPAVLEHAFGTGRTWYVAGVSRDVNARVLALAARAAGIATVDNPHEKLSIVPDLRGAGTWYINHGDARVCTGGVEVPAGDFAFVGEGLQEGSR